MPQNVPTQPKIMLVGAGHWSNPGKDYKSVEFDDMLRPERQQQIQSCLDQLARFAPTSVGVEVMASADDALNVDFRRYRRGEFALTANERHQLGFRLAAMMEHDRIHAIDWHDMEREIGWDRAIAFAREHSQPQLIMFFNTMVEEGPEERETEAARVRRLSVQEQLLETNDPVTIAESHQVYMDLALVGKGEGYIGADVVLRWYERNMKIFVNIARLVESPTDRIVVFIGGGHLPLLTQFLASSGRFDIVSAREFLE